MAKSSSPGPDVRRKLGDLVLAAGTGRADLAWLHKAIRKAGYVPAKDVLTQADVRAAVKHIIEALDAASALSTTNPCCRETLHRAIQPIQVDAGR